MPRPCELLALAAIGLGVTTTSVLGADAVEELPAPTLGLDLQPAAEEAAPPPPQGWLDGWTGSVEMGLNGSDGNTETFNIRAGLGAERKASDVHTTASVSYSRATTDGDETENKLLGKVRNDWLLDGPWRLFAEGIVEYDEFQDWDTRLSAFGGVGYEFIENDRTSLVGRIGGGVTREVGGADNHLKPELLLGLDLTHQLNERQKVAAGIDFFPSLERVGPYRFDSYANWQILVDPETNMSLKLGVRDRYDSDPGAGFGRNDIDYFAVLVWSF